MGKHREEWKLRLPKEYEKLLKESLESEIERASYREQIRSYLSSLEALKWQIPQVKKDNRIMSLEYLISHQEKIQKQLDQCMSALETQKKWKEHSLKRRFDQ